MKDLAISLVEDIRAHRLQVLNISSELSELTKDKALLENKFQQEISANKDLKNADSRKAALLNIKTTDVEYISLEEKVLALGNKKDLEVIDLQYCQDMLKVHLAFTGES